MDLFTIALVITVVVLIGSYLYKAAYNGYDLFEKKGIPTLKLKPFVGSFYPIYFRKVTLMDFVRNIYNERKDAKVVGLFDRKTPVYLIRDPELIKQIGVKDFDHFVDHRNVLDEKLDPLFGNNLVNLTGQKWKDMRGTLSPMFTGSKMRQMFQFIVDIGEQMSDHFKNASPEDRIVEMKDVGSRFAMDVIATTNFGIKINSLSEKDNDFYSKVKRLMNFTDFSTQVKFLIIMLAPWLQKLLGLQFISDDRTKFLLDTINDSIDYRDKNKVERPDLIQLMVQLKKGTLSNQTDDTSKDDVGFATIHETEIDKKKVQRKWSDNELMAQAFIFFLAGFDTVATAGSFIAYELALNPDIQQRLADEIDDTVKELNGKPLTYELLQKMKYIDQVVSEGLRFWPPADVTDRMCVKDYKMVNENGEEFVIEKGHSVWFPILGIQRSEEYYENPEKFDPDRFSDENKDKINPATYLPFGIGPRACIGSRFALMELKCFLFHLIRDFSIEVTSKTEIPLTFKKGFGKLTENGIWLELKPRKK